jgi:alpha-beta hydrolase superfamily lysophospholipase
MKFKKSTIGVIIILVSLATVVGLSGLNFLMPETQNYTDNYAEKDENNMEKIFLTTKDNVKIAADLYGEENPLGWLVLVHMRPATKESWTDLAEEFIKYGYESIAIDLRGHGESDGGPNGYANFSSAEEQKSILDLEAAVNYLVKDRKATSDKISFIGASIGANLALQYISEHPEVKTAVLLSAGLNYRGIQTEPLVKNLKAGQKVFFASSQDDPNAENNVQENQKLHDLVPLGVGKQIKIYETAGHGTTMLEKEPELKELIWEFIKLK